MKPTFIIEPPKIGSKKPSASEKVHILNELIHFDNIHGYKLLSTEYINNSSKMPNHHYCGKLTMVIHVKEVGHLFAVMDGKYYDFPL